MQKMLAQRAAMVGGLGQYQLKVDEYANQVELAKQKMELAGQAMRAGGIMMIDPPERQPSMISRLLGKVTT